MKNRWKISILASVVILAMLACNLPGRIAADATNTPAPVIEATPETPDEPTAETPTDTPEPETPTEEPEDPVTEGDCTADSEFVADITIADGTLVEPGDAITKTWRIRNDGTCTWTTSYVWEQVNFDDARLKAESRTIPLTAEVAPGGTIDISVELSLASGTSVGSMQVARFQMRSAGGTLFGTRPFALIFAAPGTGVCPVGNADQATFINAAEGYCFLYPDDYDADIGAGGDTFVKGPVDASLTEDIPPSVSISNEGSTGGDNLNQWTNQMVDDWKAPGTTPDIDNVNINGMSGKQTDDLPGMVGNRIVFLVHDGDGYVFTVLPVDNSFPEKKADALALWNMIRNSFTFFVP